MDQALINASRDRLAPRLLELSRRLNGTPTAATIAMVRGELERIGRG
jgi:hypothetical protein